MNKQMYDLVKTAMKEGKSIEDVIAEVNTMAEAAQKEIQPQEPLKEKFGRLYPGKVAHCISLEPDGKFAKYEIIELLARYYVQNGFNPDVCFDTEEEFLDSMGEILDGGLRTSKMAENLFGMQKAGRSDEEIGKAALGNLMDILLDSINIKIDDRD